MQLIGINNLIILNKLFAKLEQLIIINFLEYSLIRIIRVVKKNINKKDDLE